MNIFNRNVSVINAFPTWLPQTQTWMHSQVAELQRLGVDVHVVCERTENLDQFGVANIHCLADESEWRQVLDKGIRKLRLRRHLAHLIKVGRQTGAQIVHSHFGNVGWVNLGAIRKLGAKHVVTFYGLDVNKLPQQTPIWRKRYQQLFRETDLFLCEGSHMARCLVELGCPDHKVQVQHLGVDVDSLEFRPRQWQADEPLKVLIAASFREKKGIPYALGALGLLSKKVPIELTLIGDAGSELESQHEKRRILDALKHSGLKTRTRLLGYQPHKAMLKEAYDHHIFLQPSVTAADGDTEGGAPVSIIEMLATGMLVVSTTHCDIPEVIGPDLQHLLAPERDVESLVACMVSLVQKPSYWDGWVLAGRHHVEVEYNKVKQAECLLAKYQALVKM
jgi:colanic acid/amylovoran biosynthesis glycosyltransferase